MGADAEWLAGTLMPAPGKCEKRAEGEREGVRGLGRAEARATDTGWRECLFSDKKQGKNGRTHTHVLPFLVCAKVDKYWTNLDI